MVIGIAQTESESQDPQVELERPPQMDPRLHCESSSVGRSDAPTENGLTVVPVQAQVYC